MLSLTQVLSRSVADALEYCGDPDMKETVLFVRKFDRFFDMLNTRSLEEGIHRRKPDLAPYRTPEDTRLKASWHTIKPHTITMRSY